MKHRIMLITVVFILGLGLSSCRKQQPSAPPQEPPAPTQLPAEPIEQAPPAEEVEPAGGQAQMAPIPLVLPKPQFVGTPENIQGVDNLEKPLGSARPPFLAPAGTEVVSRDKPVTGSETDPIIGTFEMIVDGDKEAGDGSVVELGPFTQWIQIDLEKEYDIYAVVLWHYHRTPRVYFDVIVQISTDPEFITDVTTIYNNDLDNSSGQGVGEDNHYVETAEGRLIDAKGTRGRYVRCYSNGNNQNDMNHYIEVEVFGKSVQ